MKLETKEGNVPYNKVYVVAKSNAKAVFKIQINELATMMDTLYLNHKDGNPIGSGWQIQSIE